MNLKKTAYLVNVVVILSIAIGMILFFMKNDYKARKKVHNNAINNIIIKKEINYIGGGGKDYTTDNGFVIPLPHHDTIEVGDSISKIKNNSIINVYRKNNDASYSFYKSFNISSD